MAKLNLQQAEYIAERDATPKCRSCSDVAPEGEVYCWNCKTYWDDCVNGLWDDFEMEQPNA